MEKKLVTAYQGHLPCITNRSNLSADILNGTDATIAFEDFLGQPENCESAMTGIFFVQSFNQIIFGSNQNEHLRVNLFFKVCC